MAYKVTNYMPACNIVLKSKESLQCYFLSFGQVYIGNVYGCIYLQNICIRHNLQK